VGADWWEETALRRDRSKALAKNERRVKVKRRRHFRWLR
jgi:hypothetical protein